MGSDQSPAGPQSRPLHAPARTANSALGGLSLPGAISTPSRRTFVSVAVLVVLFVAAAGTGVGVAAADGANVEAGTSTAENQPVVDDRGQQSTYVGSGTVTHVEGVQDSQPSLVDAIGAISGESIVLLAGYTRYGEGSPLEHPVRSDVVDVATRLPGVQLPDVVRSVDASSGSVRYHVRVLEREGHLATATVWGATRLYPADVDESAFELHAALRDDSRSSVLRAIEGTDPAIPTSIAEQIDRAPSTVSHHLSLLEDADLVERERSGQSVHVSLAPEVSDHIAADGTSADPIGADCCED